MSLTLNKLGVSLWRKWVKRIKNEKKSVVWMQAGQTCRFQRRTCWKMVSPAPRDGGHSQGRDTRQVYYTATEDDQARRRTEHMKKKLPHIVSSLIFKRQILLHHVVLLLI
ncbi:uncharacterized protein LOC110936474 isoform X1 [Helianthus annuus]|uniref:uncharacterized protein LOC110936474 isoform X1 n=1 Tax=Helianthus annuus TaxID=4232 RepID=UPI000B8F9F0B|nr:uncharacterized protein LOC110936474 isoform X1 [Helianthus annuus]